MPDRVLIVDVPWDDLSLERAELEKVGAELVRASANDPATLAREIVGCSALLTDWTPIPAAVLEAGGDRDGPLRLVARMGTGVDHIDLAAAARLGIPVTRLPDYCVEEVADHTLALLLAIRRRVVEDAAAVRRGEWEEVHVGDLRRLRGNVLGLIGFGRTAAAVRERALPFGFTVLGENRTGDDRGTGCEMVARAELLERSDVVSLHAPLSAETARMVDAAFLARMKPGAVLLNVARGGLIDADAVLAALESGRLAAVGLDVFESEPPGERPEDWHPLVRHPRAIVTPHTAFLSRESLVEIRARPARQVADALAGRRPEHLVDPTVWERRETTRRS
ncbi:C-terminal binding protein [Alienimonas californiensis]|uniref:Glycerate dehydrogenase n=1 Tax=Alienimonas californiensis TaxID=2527989 RepID=A0A517P9U9_9PLAN|nr:C-terminal binding protein [Alienimonas californiensis]QDT16150.1 Glycerate dehydrogenase [Alienimonas californiensis]